LLKALSAATRRIAASIAKLPDLLKKHSLSGAAALCS